VQPIRVACVRYLNTQPLIHGLDRVQGLTLLPCVPSAIGAMVARGEADVGLASIVDAVTIEPPLALLPVGMIGCDGPTLTVRIFSAVPIDRIAILHADTDSHTSVVLARLILLKVYGVGPEVESHGPGDADDPSRDPRLPESVLLIGDKVVTDHPPAARYPYQLDLGEAWHTLTGLPFVYAMWMCRADHAESSTIALARSLLERQLRHNLGRLEWLVAHHSPRSGWPLDLARRYLGTLLRYEVGPRERTALATFFAMAVASGLLPDRRPIEMLPTRL